MSVNNNELEMGSSGQDRSIDLTKEGGIIFKEDVHSYTNADGLRYTGITTLLGRFHDHFDAEKTSVNKSIKDNVIRHFGEQMYRSVMADSRGEERIQENYDKLQASLGTEYEYNYLNIINKVIKDVTIEAHGEEKYMMLEKQTHGFANLYRKLNRIKADRPEFYREIEEKALIESSIAKYGGEKYKVLAKSVDGFDNLGTELGTFESKMPKLYKKIMKRIPELKQEWVDTNLRAVTEGSAEHDKREQEIYDDGGYEWNGIWFEYIKGKNIMNVTLEDTCVIPECMVWNHEMRLGGLADIFLFHKGTIYVLDYKTNATVDIVPKINNKKYWTYMTGVCSELLDLNFFHYSLQLKIYQEMALMLRPDFKAGINIIIHTTSDTHYRYEDAIIECHDVSEIVPKMFDQLREELKNVA